MSIDFSSLNQEQREAIEHLQGPLLVLAGAGTGKTRVITTRIANLIDHGVGPKNILAVTFTNKASKEMRERLEQMLSKSTAEAVTVGTFHSFCIRLLRQHITLLGYAKNFSIADDTYQSDLLRSITAEHKISGEGCNPNLWLSLISKAKGEMLGPEEFADRFSGVPRIKEAALVFQTYQRRLKQMNLIDFDDILALVLKLWDNHPNILEQHRNQYQYLLIDEYQDTNEIQFHLIKSLAFPKNNLCVVGDDDQSIYAWRGANIANILSFDQQYTDAKVIRLEQNYRSMGNILNAANHVIAKNRTRHHKILRTTKNEGEKIRIVRCSSAEDEAKCIADYIVDRLASFNNDYSNFAILFRSNKQARLLELYLRRSNIPYSITGAYSFFKTKEIQDLISFLQQIENSKDNLSLLRIINVPPRHIGDTSVDHLHETAIATGAPMRQLLNEECYHQKLTPKTLASVKEFSNLLDEYTEKFQATSSIATTFAELLTSLNYKEAIPTMYTPRENAMRRLENIDEFISFINDFEKRKPNARLREFLDSLSLLDNSEQNKKDSNEKQVSLITVHSSKGLEFPSVVIAGMERNLFPNERAIQEGMLEEERRLFYVAVTRAQKECLLTFAEIRKIAGAISRQRGSIFLDELPIELCEYLTPDKLIKPLSQEDMASQLKAIMDRL